jgi:putative toxin-antitoxin system antitoxin component (TIGR02293 family)
MAQNKSGSGDSVSSEIAIPVGSLVNELTMTVKIPNFAPQRGVTESPETLKNIKPGEVVVVRSDRRGHVTVVRAAQASKRSKETAILRYLFYHRIGQPLGLRPQLQAELKWSGGKRLYLLTPKGIPTGESAPSFGGFSTSELPTAQAFQAAADGTLDMLAQEGFSDAELFELVVPKRTLARREANKEPLTVDETDKALRLARIAEMANKVFGDKEKAHRWLRKSKRSLDGHAPLTYLSSETGARVVEEMLFRIESGILA